ncbi:MAG: DUF4421 family protein [Sphingobacteriaceae bacterium]|nr:DUF4421 family protein [Sphingobacteriaceae bacterium]
MYKYFVLIAVFFSTFLDAQDVEVKVAQDSLRFKKIKTVKWDTTKYRKYNYVFIVGVFNQYRDFNNEIIQEINKDSLHLSNQTYVAESNVTGGLSISYDKFQINLGTRTKPREDQQGKGYTKMFNIGFNFGDNRWVSENYYRRFKGFYNKSTPNFDTNYKHTNAYYLQPNMSSSLFMSRLLYFSNYENFSYKSGFGSNFRQLKSAFTWIIGVNYSAYTMLNDSSVIPIQARHLFNDYAQMRGLKSFNIGGTFGAAATIVVFKAWFINGHFSFGPEIQNRNYDFTTHSRRISYIGASGIGRFSMGLNLNKFYFLVSINNDYNLYNSKKIIKIKSEAITHNLTLGWRFNSGEPIGFYRKFQQTRLYKLFG